MDQLTIFGKGLVYIMRARFFNKITHTFELAYYEAYKSEKDARMREHNLKLRRNAYVS